MKTAIEVEMTDHDNRGSLNEQLADDLDRAFPLVVRNHVDGIYSGALRLTGDRHEAEDIVQETFLRAHRALARYDRRRCLDLQLAPWLWTIALNLCRNRARDESRRPRHVGLDVVAEQRAGDDPAGEALAAIDDTWRTRLSALAEHERHAVVLRHVAGLSYRELSGATQRPLGTVKSDVHRGLQRLRAIIEGEGIEGEGIENESIENEGIENEGIPAA